MSEEILKTYKGFNEDMTCRGFKFEEGKEYEEEKAEACECGFHACEYPLDVFNYYPPNESVFHEVEQSGDISRDSENSKVASTKIKIGASINIAGLVKAAIEYTTKRVKKENGSDEDKGASSAEDKESIAIAWGYKSKAKGVKGSHLVFADWEGNEDEYYKPDSWTLKGAKMVQVDGEIIKENTWYVIKNGEIVEEE